MKQAVLLTRYVAVLALPCAILGASVGSAATSVGHLRRQHPIVALQAAHEERRASQSKSWLGHAANQHQHLAQHLKTMSKRKGEASSAGSCRGNKFKWWIKIKKKCRENFGKDSRWDRNKGGGDCSEAWSECNSGMYAICCSQPVGAQTMDAYCESQNSTSANTSEAADDKACQFQGSMRDVQATMRSIKDTISTMGVPSGQVVNAGPAPAPAEQGDEREGAETADATEDADSAAVGLAKASNAAPMAAPMVVAPAPAPLQQTSQITGPGATAALAKSSPAVPTQVQLVDKCAMLKELVSQAAERIAVIKRWASKDGIKDGSESMEQEFDPDTEEAKDPELVFAVKGVVHAGDKLDVLLKNPDFCSGGAGAATAESKESNEDGTESESERNEDTGSGDEEEDENDTEEHAKKDAVHVNETAILGLLNWETDMSGAVEKFEKDVHPHGFKWWRYRYEYTFVESLVLATCMMFLYFVMFLLHGVSFFEINRFYKTGQPHKLHRYAWAYLVFHAASLMFMVTLAYMLYIPWGKENIFNWFATYTHKLVDGYAKVPFLGYSWLYMILDVQFQLFFTFALYALFIVSVTKNFENALYDWKLMSLDDQDSSVSAINAEMYKHVREVFIKRLDADAEYRQILHECKLNFPGVTGLNSLYPHTFSLHLYLTDGLGKSVEYLVQVSLTTNLFLALSALLVAVLAQHYQVAFMYFLPGFLVIGLVLFICGYFVSRHFRKMASRDDSYAAREVTVYSYCRAIQVALYCIFFSFARLLLSNDIFEFYPRVYFASVLGLLVTLGLVIWVAGECIKETVCALTLPPHVPVNHFRFNVQQVDAWYQAQNCHECGVPQLPAEFSYSREWAGDAKHGHLPKEIERMTWSPRMYTWRG